MKRILAVTFFVVFGFYVVWPAVSALQLRNALDREDRAEVARKIDIDALRASLDATAKKEAERVISEQLERSGSSAGLLAADIARKAMPKLIDVSLRVLVTPDTIVRLYTERGSVKDAISRALSDQVARAGGLSGLGTLAAAPAPSAEAPVPGTAQGGTRTSVVRELGQGAVDAPASTLPPPRQSPVRTLGAPAGTADGQAAPPAPPAKGFALAHVRGLRFAGPFAVEVDLARDAAFKQADLTAVMGFTGLDWKLTGLRPAE